MQALKRKQALVELLKTQALSNQSEVVSAMQQKGIEVTQPSISRDFRELGVVKLGGRYVIASPAQAQVVTSLETNLEMIRSAQAVGDNLIIVKTPAAAGSIVASEIDARSFPGVIGTVAGDDTIFIAVSDKENQRNLIEELI